eukprot:3617241-Rhodomonas_salina.2
MASRLRSSSSGPRDELRSLVLCGCFVVHWRQHLASVLALPGVSDSGMGFCSGHASLTEEIVTSAKIERGTLWAVGGVPANRERCHAQTMPALLCSKHNPDSRQLWRGNAGRRLQAYGM